MNKPLITLSAVIAVSVLSFGLVAARPVWRQATVTDRAYCAAVQGALGADLGIHHHPSLDFTGDGYTDASDLSYFGAKANDSAWCRGVLSALVAESAPLWAARDTRIG